MPLRIIGLDTALLAADDQDRGRLYLGKEQLARALAEPPQAPGELLLVLGHHPLQGGWLADEREAASWLRNHAHVHLFGHIHEASSEDGGPGPSCPRPAAPVGSLPAGQGPYGHQDLAGNVWEWCLDAWDDRSYEKRGPLTIDPPEADESGDDAARNRACRGGSFFAGSWRLRSACRFRARASDRFYDFGFRVAAFPASRRASNS